MLQENEVYTREEVSSFLKISKSTFMRLVKRGAIRAFKVGNQYRILGSEILRLIDPALERKATKIYRRVKERILR